MVQDLFLLLRHSENRKESQEKMYKAKMAAEFTECNIWEKYILIY